MTHDTISVSPYVMPNSYGYNPEKNVDGQSMMDWQTGSSNVTLKLLVRFVAGVRPEYDGVWVQPAAYCPFGAFTAEVPGEGRGGAHPVQADRCRETPGLQWTASPRRAGITTS